VRIYSLIAALFAIFVTTSPVAAATCLGYCGNMGANGSITTPPVGTTYGFISTTAGTLGAGEIAGIGGVNGSEYITSAFTANVGNLLSFNFNYITTDGAGYSDYAFAELLSGSGSHVAYLFTARTRATGNTSPGFGLPANSSTLSPTNTPILAGTIWSPLGRDSGTCYAAGCGHTGWVASTYNIATTGSYALRFGVTNFGDTFSNSGLAFTGAVVTVQGNYQGIGSVPEPASWAMMILGFVLIGATLRRQAMPVLLAAPRLAC
jgi:hypothetical protein